ncbi:efflux transporter, outer membrane factor (OMF) lipoprotein, NodT family [Duganella sp. CF458]|uniref:efflux transporter outer membrane subunit n=1 Tax=Duganella sp. CF458 TaxID=1884368 RepID=UPI0008EF46C0|nr:efflux transporter outer membrane subunit [Duganella sp. CF458]SFG04052.1 efflux transporter, outer membrane factor (OMF) lipoprotein, NodT family [Duganella sp. CF458]
MKQLTIPLLCLSLAACAVGPDYHAPAVPAPAAYGDWHGGSPALRETGLAAGAEQAFARFDDPVLAGLQKQALAASHDVQTAALRFAQSRMARNAAAGAQGPQLTAHAGASRQRQSESGAGTRMVDAIAPANRAVLIEKLSDPFALYQAGFDASWELDLWGRVRRSVQAADAGMAEASSVLRAVRIAVQLEVARNYYELRAAHRQQALLQEDLSAARDMAALVAARQHGGLASGLDVEQQQAALAELVGRAPALLEQEAAAANRLTMLLALPPGALRGQLAARLGAAAPRGPDLALGVPGEVMRHRPDIQAAEARLQGATARIGVALADLYPRITLGLSFGVEALEAGKFGDWGSRQWSLGPSLQLPLFDNGRRRATVELRKLEEQEAAVNFQKTVLNAWHEMDDALSAYAAARQRQQALTTKAASARAALELAATRARRGMSDQLPVLQARRALLAIERERAAGDSELALRLLAVCKASGLAPQA